MNYIKDHKRLFVAVIIIICVIAAVLTAGYRFRPNIVDNALGFVVTPVQAAATKVSSWFSGKTNIFADTNTIIEENKKLKTDLQNLQAENRSLKLKVLRVDDLQELLKVDEKYPDYEKVGAETIAKDTSNWFGSFIINKGKKDGFSEDLIVLSEGGLVGRIIKAADTYSEVISLIDDKSAVSVKCVRTEDFGILTGDVTLMKSGQCRLNFISLDAQIMEGDELITSTLGDIYPPGITVGYVKEVKMDSKRLTKYAIVEPLVDFKNIETVLVVMDKYDRFKTGGE